MPTATQIANALGGYPGGQVRRRFRYYLSTKMGTKGAEITRAIRAASVTLDNFRAVMRTAHFTIDPARVSVTIEPATSIVRIEEELWVSGAWYVIPWGVFRLTIPQETHGPNRQRWEVEANDLSTYLYTTALPEPYVIASGTNYMTAIATVLAAMGFNYALPAVAGTLPVAVTFPPATATYGDVVAKLAWDVNYHPPWMMASGLFTICEREDPSTQVPVVSYSNIPPYMVRGELGKKLDTSRYYNQAVVLIDNPARAPGYALRKNNDPTSPISIAATGVTNNQEFSGGSVLDLTMAATIADAELRYYAARATQMTVKTALDGRREGHEVYVLNVGPESSTHWLALGWSADLVAAGTMTHTIGSARQVTLSS